jgi:hypothetical protein
MSSAGNYRQSRKWAIGETSERRFDVGPIAANGTETPGQLCLVRVSYGDRTQQGLLTSDVRLGDEGTILDGIDVPFAMVCEAPVNVVLRPLAALPVPVQAECVVTPVFGQVDQYAIRTVTLQLNQVVELPQWVRVVYCLEPAELIFLDRAAVALNTSADGWHVRPPVATQLQASVAGTFLLAF